MEYLEDYEIIHDDSSIASSLLVRHKTTKILYCLHIIPCNDLSENEQKVLLKKITTRINLSHPNIIRFYAHNLHNNVIYLKQDHCKYGTLKNFIQKECLEKNRQLHEDLICRILYQTVFALKTLECFMGQVSLDTILLEEDFSVKLFNFFHIDTNGNMKHQKQKEIKMSQLGTIMFELCTFKPLEKSSFKIDLENQNYTEAFKGLVISMVEDNTEIKKHINRILCHPTVLLQSSQWNKERCFNEKRCDQSLKISSSLDPSSNSLTREYSEKLEKLARKEAKLQVKEQLLKEQERKLANKEKKLHIMERTVKEKLQQAELYLKRCREGGKSLSSVSSKSSTHSQSSSQSKTMSYEEDIDPTYVSCGDSDVFPTSTKLQVDKIVKPQHFARSLSERRIRFKTSPLKDHNITRKPNARKSVLLRHSKILEECDNSNIAEELNNESSGATIKRKSLFLSNSEYENDGIMESSTKYSNEPNEVKNMGWTEETKKYAFEMLRLMNNDEKENIEMKHTYL